MILFYSEHCPHCRMLLDTIRRHDQKNTIKLLSIEALKASNKLPKSIHSVPALMTLPEKQLMFGKQVFDYLLLPGSGKLLSMSAPAEEQSSKPIGQPTSMGNPSAFTLGANLSDNFSSIADDGASNQLDDRVYNWSNINQIGTQSLPDMPLQEDTRVKKDLPDIDYIRQQREVDLRGDVDVNSMPHPAATRDT